MTAGTSASERLEVLEERRDAASLWQRVRVPRALSCLEGHFPELPVLPGLALLAWLADAGGRLVGHRLAPTRIEALKFRELIGPGEEVEARVELAGGDEVLRFTARRAGRPAASCRFYLGSASEGLGVVAAPLPSVFRIPARELIPHAGPMVFVTDVLGGDEKQTFCGVRVEELALFRDPDGTLPAWAGIEPMAQCVAAHGGREARRRGQAPRVGFLLGCRRLEIRAERLEPGVDYAVSAAQVWGGETGLVSFDCQLYEVPSGRRLLAGRINAYLPEDLGALGEGRLG